MQLRGFTAPHFRRFQHVVQEHEAKPSALVQRVNGQRRDVAVALTAAVHALLIQDAVRNVTIHYGLPDRP